MRLIDFSLYPKQVEFLGAREPIRGFVGGQGCGKSRIGAYDLICKARPGRLYMVVAPTYTMLRDATFRTFEAVARQCGVLVRTLRGEQFSATIRTTNGELAEVLFRSGENADRLRGPNLSGAWLDEASLLDHEVYQVMVARLREAGERGWLTATFTPKGVAHWTYDVFGRRKPETFLVTARTRDNPFLAEDFVHTVYTTYSGSAATQELEGAFVDSDDGWQVIPTSWVQEAMDRWNPDGKKAKLSCVGVDCARGGADQTVLARRYGTWFAPLERHPGATTKDGKAVAGLVQRAVLENHTAWANVDVIGIGASPFDFCKEMGIKAMACNFATRVDARDSSRILKFYNLRAYAYWSVRECLDPSRPEKDRLVLPPDQELLQDLTAPKWSMELTGVKVESKEDIAKRLGRSTDCGDAVALAVLLPGPGWGGKQGPIALEL